jgi:glycerol-3-phosphate dehydrogenase
MVIDLMGEELQWNQNRKDLEWTDTVHFLASMGLPESKLNVTREQVLSGEATQVVDEPFPRRNSPAETSRSAPEVRSEEVVGLEPESPANIYP